MPIENILPMSFNNEHSSFADVFEAIHQDFEQFRTKLPETETCTHELAVFGKSLISKKQRKRRLQIYTLPDVCFSFVFVNNK